MARFPDLFFFFCVVCLVCSSNGAPPKRDEILLVISYDGFRPEYLQRHVTPTLNNFREEGTWARKMRPVFPTKTFVNHFSIATGLYAEKHGVLANQLYDQKRGYLRYSYELFHYDKKTISIWTANEMSGKHSGCWWPGSDYEYNGLTLKAEKLDNVTKYVQEKLIENNLENQVNVIFLSDHGMSGVVFKNVINLKDFVNEDCCMMYGTSPILQIVPNDPSKENEIFANLTKAAKINGHFKVYNEENILDRWHANNSRRFGPIIALADVGYAFQDLQREAKDYYVKQNIPITNETIYGCHGYDNIEPSMDAVFMAKGPIFPKGKVLESVNVIDMFDLFCFILQIECNDSDGTTPLDIWN